MAYTTKYRIPLLSPGVAGVIGSEVRIDILIKERDYNGSATVLKGTAGVAELQYRDNDEKKYPSIQGSGLDIHFYSESDFNLEDVITADDFQYKTSVVIDADENAKELWTGFLVTDDCFESMQDDPKEITLRATDGLGLLKNNPLYDIDVYEKKTLLEIIERCLSFTGLELDLLIECNVFEQSMSDRTDDPAAHPFNQCMVHTTSFLEDANTYKNCYEVLESIMTSFQCGIFQQNGAWHIMRKHDRWNQSMLYATRLQYPYTSNVGVAHVYDYQIPVDSKERYPINADHIKSFTGVSKYSRIQYDYNPPFQMPRNNNFLQGSLFAPISGPSNIATRIDFWTFEDAFGAIPKTPYRNQIYDPETGAPKESYIVLPRRNPTEQGETGRLKSSIVEVSYQDRVRISGEWKPKYDYGSDSEFAQMFIVRILLYGKSGTTYSYDTTINTESGIPDKLWSTNINNPVKFSYRIRAAKDWQTFDVETLGMPEDGDLTIEIYNSSWGPDNNELWYRNIRFDWLLFVNNTTQIKGEYDKLENSGTFRNNAELSILVGDAPKRIISGALFRTDGVTLTSSWHRQGKDETERLIRLNDISLYQSTYRLYTSIDGSFLGNTYTTQTEGKGLVGPANIFTFTHDPLLNKAYTPTNMDISLGSNTFRMSAKEFFDSIKDKGDPQGDQKYFGYLYE
ncbi:hypothetical protein [Agriterribacter sp.]|uniref:hypothetical protein n=1 Tax=Agriterribacter sp. TaxID=2821509 RepID=UPI002C3E5177|nr:hypothetical protein [Agriterribacter sp.]HRO47683.1 hypothetical protein [Agriterribacter sp.]HRQ17664.1 hypothetical protein [Agriterribacter sp.]